MLKMFFLLKIRVQFLYLDQDPHFATFILMWIQANPDPHTCFWEIL